MTNGTGDLTWANVTASNLEADLTFKGTTTFEGNIALTPGAYLIQHNAVADAAN